VDGPRDESKTILFGVVGSIAPILEEAEWDPETPCQAWIAELNSTYPMDFIGD
jgi:hypothetical protein